MTFQFSSIGKTEKAVVLGLSVGVGGGLGAYGLGEWSEESNPKAELRVLRHESEKLTKIVVEREEQLEKKEEVVAARADLIKQLDTQLNQAEETVINLTKRKNALAIQVNQQGEELEKIRGQFKSLDDSSEALKKTNKQLGKKVQALAKELGVVKPDWKDANQNVPGPIFLATEEMAGGSNQSHPASIKTVSQGKNLTQDIAALYDDLTALKVRIHVVTREAKVLSEKDRELSEKLKEQKEKEIKLNENIANLEKTTGELEDRAKTLYSDTLEASLNLAKKENENIILRGEGKNYRTQIASMNRMLKEKREEEQRRKMLERARKSVRDLRSPF